MLLLFEQCVVVFVVCLFIQEVNLGLCSCVDTPCFSLFTRCSDYKEPFLKTQLCLVSCSACQYCKANKHDDDFVTHL